ncbi:NADPH oxidase 4-like [Clavelina lepadiformis]|uniref:NADPH oxidase 4-like n=1 Tax=Clavelina lepadiformis TaxID=159417 RepID=UPI0040430C4D
MLPSVKSYLINQSLKHFIAVAWLAINVVLFYYTFMYYYTGPQFYYLHKMLGLGLCISRASARCINLNSTLLLIPMCKRLITCMRSSNYLMGRQARRMLDHGKSFHIYCGHLLCFLAVIHCGAHGYNVVYFSKYYNPKYSELNVAKYTNENPLIMLVTTLAGLTGLFLVFTLVVIAVFASKPMRKKHNRFWATHHMFIIYYGLLLVHAMDGVIKYQTNLDEHTPGCLMIINQENNDTASMEPIVFPEPEPHPEPMPHMKKAMVKREAEQEMSKRKTHKQSKMRKRDRKTNRTIPKKPPTQKVPQMFDDTKFYRMVMPEPEPMPHGGDVQSNGTLEMEKVFYNGTWMSAKPCNQPRPKFASCPKEVWIWLCLPLALYLVERLIRLFRVTNVPAEIVHFKLHQNEVMELKLSQKGFKAKPGQNVWLRCPFISHVELHPFSLTSVPCENDPTFSVHIQVKGDWTSKLYEALAEIDKSQPSKQDTTSGHQNVELMSNRQDTASPIELHVETCNNQQNIYASCEYQNKVTALADHTKRESEKIVRKKKEFDDTAENQFPILRSIFIEGPTGSAMEDVYKYKVSLCVAGGIGVTPFASVLNALLKDQSVFKNMKLQRMYFIWACRNTESFEWFANLIEDVQVKLWNQSSPDLLSVHLFLTQTQQNHVESQCPTLTKLKRCRISYSRPNIADIVETVSKCHPRSTVGVFSCGPRKLLEAVKAQCLHPSSNTSTKFIFNKEAF